MSFQASAEEKESSLGVQRTTSPIQLQLVCNQALRSKGRLTILIVQSYHGLYKVSID